MYDTKKQHKLKNKYINWIISDDNPCKNSMLWRLSIGAKQRATLTSQLRLAKFIR
jgi:hypothetical protein